MSLQFGDKDVLWHHVKGLTETLIDGICCSSVVDCCHYSIIELVLTTVLARQLSLAFTGASLCGFITPTVQHYSLHRNMLLFNICSHFSESYLS